MNDCVGLFGTCANTKWRDGVIAEFEKHGIPYFNPLVEVGKWTPENAVIEAEHLANDKCILMIITGDAESYGSLAEVGWAALSCRMDSRDFVLVIEDYPGGDNLPNRTRQLVLAHARKAKVNVMNSVADATRYIIDNFNKIN